MAWPKGIAGVEPFGEDRTMTDVFLHNPRCSKSRAALELVRDAGVELPVREYLRDPLSVDELRRIIQLLGVRPEGAAHPHLGSHVPFADLKTAEKFRDPVVVPHGAAPGDLFPALILLDAVVGNEQRPQEQREHSDRKSVV